MLNELSSPVNPRCQLRSRCVIAQIRLTGAWLEDISEQGNTLLLRPLHHRGKYSAAACITGHANIVYEDCSLSIVCVWPCQNKPDDFALPRDCNERLSAGLALPDHELDFLLSFFSIRPYQNFWSNLLQNIQNVSFVVAAGP
jgi:hypothetical protein